MDQNLITLLGTKAVYSLVTIYVINWMKKSPLFPAIHYKSDKLNHWLAVIMTGLTSIGINFTYDPVAHTVLITGLAWPVIKSYLWNWLEQYAIVKLNYQVMKGSLKPEDIKPIVDVLKSVPANKG